jgi:hypothetical protein
LHCTSRTSTAEGGDVDEQKKDFVARMLIRLHLGNQAGQRHLAIFRIARLVDNFFSRHNLFYFFGTCLLLAVPVPIGWWIFALLLSIPDPIARPVAIWTYIIAMFAILGQRFDSIESSPIDRALDG